MSSNPFSNEERVNFPEFDAVFKPDRISPNDKEKLFRWSIDQLAQLKPIDIGTSPASLAHTMNFCSPHDDPQSQAEVEKFFAQKCIHPSPWLPPKTTGSKHVTFSPHPPATTYFTREDDTIIKSDVSTQTSLSIPMDFDLEKLLINYSLYNNGGNGTEENSFSLRRKLFGEPQRTPDDSADISCDNNTKLSLDTQRSSTPLRSPFSPFYNDNNCIDQMTSSFVNSDSDAPPILSPIFNKENRSPLNTMPSGVTSSLLFSPIVEENVSTDIIIKPILKRLYHGSPHPPEVKHYCPEVKKSSVLSEDSIPAVITIGDLQTDITTPSIHMTTPSTACTTHFNNMEIIEECEKPVVDSLVVSSWQPKTNSTMVTKPCVDSGYDTREHESVSCDNHMIEITHSEQYCCVHQHTENSIVFTPPSRYMASTDPVNKDLIRRKNYLKAKLSIATI